MKRILVCREGGETFLIRNCFQDTNSTAYICLGREGGRERDKWSDGGRELVCWSYISISHHGKKT